MELRALTTAVIVMVAIVLGWALHVGKGVIVPIVCAFGIAYVVYGLTMLLHKVSIARRRLPVPACYLASILLIGAVLAFAVEMLALNADAILRVAPRLQEAALALARAISTWMHFEDEPTWESLRRDVIAAVNFQSLITTTIYSLSSVVVNLFLVVLYAAFLLLERRVLNRKIELMFGGASGPRVRAMLDEVNGRIGQYLALKTLLSVLLGGVSWAVMAWYGLQLAELWALLIGVTNFIPYVGSVVGVAMPVLMAVLQFGSFGDVLFLSIALISIQFVIGNILDPYVMGNSLNLSPLAILASIAVWSALWGMSGAFLAVPLTVSLVIALAEFDHTRPIAILLSKNGLPG